MTTFSVGEVVRMVADDSTADWAAVASNGLEAVVIAGLGYHDSHTNGVYYGKMMGYCVRSVTGAELVCEPHQLRKRRPPSTDESESRQAMLDCIERARRPVGVPA